jgi:FkbM family methyltransferase
MFRKNGWARMRLTIGPRYREAILLLLLPCAVTAVSCKKAAESPPQRQVDFTEIVARKNQEFLHNPISTDKDSIYAARVRLQNQLLEEFAACPDCFVKKYTGAQRTYLFDAVTDCGSCIRVGTRFDGGKWIADPESLTVSSVVYSFGVGDNISFDMDMAGRFGCNVYMFDPSPSVVAGFSRFGAGQACGKGHLTYQPLGLGPVSKKADNQWNLVIEGKQCEARSLADIARARHHTRVEILKIDIEGGEFAALQEMIDTRALLSLQVRQLLVEFHLWDGQCFADFVRIIGALERQGFLIFRKEFNPYAADRCAEFSFLRR